MDPSTRRKTDKYPRLILYILATGLACAITSFAQAKDTIDRTDTVKRPAKPTATQLLEQLDHADPAVRDRASAALMQRTDIADKQLVPALRKPRSPEQYHRIINVLLHRFFSRIKPAKTTKPDIGSLGCIFPDPKFADPIVRPHQQPGLKKTPAVFIAGTLPGFPAYVHLRIGDLITAINNQPFDINIDINDFVEIMKKYKAGQTITLNVMRQGKNMQFKLKLDSVQRLNYIFEMLQKKQPAATPAFKKYLQQLLSQ